MARAKIRRGARGAGFTFIELVIVIGLIGILFAGGAVSFRGLMPRYRLRSAAKELGRTIEQVRLSSVNRGAWMGIQYVLDPADTETPYYQIVPPPPDDYPDQPLEAREPLSKHFLPPNVRFARILLAGNRAVSDGSVRVLFSPMGNSGSHIAVLAGEDDVALSVKLNAITGVIEFIASGEVTFQNFEG